MAFPSPPWSMQGQLWLSLFYAARPGEPRGVHAAGWASYEEGSTLTYSELLVGRQVRTSGDESERAITITDIWVDSEPSREGGRSLWGIPKELGEFEHEPGGLGPVGRTEWSLATSGTPVASASFADVSGVAPRVPFKGATFQVRDDGTEAIARLRGSSKALPCLAHWEFDERGPLGWLAGKQPVTSFRLRDFTMTFG